MKKLKEDITWNFEKAFAKLKKDFDTKFRVYYHVNGDESKVYGGTLLNQVDTLQQAWKIVKESYAILEKYKTQQDFEIYQGNQLVASIQYDQ